MVRAWLGWPSSITGTQADAQTATRLDPPDLAPLPASKTHRKIHQGHALMAEPRWLTLAHAEIGTKETPGPKSNPVVEGYYAEAIGSKRTDDIPWCAAFVGAMLRRAGIKPSGSLMARSYLNWGTKLDIPQSGAITVLGRGNDQRFGHVGFYVGEADKDHIYLLGGNQQDAVTIERKLKHRILGYRWPSVAAVNKE